MVLLTCTDVFCRALQEHTFRPPYFHRNIMSEFMGLIKGTYEAKEQVRCSLTHIPFAHARTHTHHTYTHVRMRMHQCEWFTAMARSACNHAVRHQHSRMWPLQHQIDHA